MDVAGAGLEHRRGQAGAGGDGGDERLDEPGPRPSDRGKRDAHLGRRRLGGGSEGRPAPDRAVGAMDRDVALEAREQRPRLRAGGIVDDDDLDVLGQVAGDQRLDLGPERGRVVAGDDQDGGPHGRLMQPGLRCLGGGRDTRRRCAAGPRPGRRPGASRGARGPSRPTGTGARSRGTASPRMSGSRSVRPHASSTRRVMSVAVSWSSLEKFQASPAMPGSCARSARAM